jgi:hypothetical protein
MLVRLLVVVTLLALALDARTPVFAAPGGQGTGRNPVIVENGLVEIRVSDRGQFTIGTVGGNPGSVADDDRRLVYGHGGSAFTSFNTIRTVENGTTRDFPLLRDIEQRPQVADGVVSMAWTLEGVRVVQTLAPADNPYTSRPDTVRIALTATNIGNEPLTVGARVMLDTMIGNNDHAPFFVPGSGNFDEEREFTGADMPVYWKAFEAADYDPASLKGQGIISGLDATPPDRFQFASWRRIKNSAWDYAISPGSPVGDSAVGLYWEPDELAAGASVTWITYYGLAGEGGGNAWIDAPVSITSAEPEFAATLWVTNLSDEDFTGGEARITLPEGLRLAEGEPEKKPMPPVPTNGGAESVTWQLVGEGGIDVDLPYSATVAFETGSDPLSASASVNYRFIAPPATVTPEPTASPTPTPAAVPPPVAVPASPAPEGRFPWPLLLIPLLGLPLLLLLLRRSPARPTNRVAPPRVPRTAPQPDFTERAEPGEPPGANVTHGRPRRDVRDGDETLS